MKKTILNFRNDIMTRIDLKKVIGGYMAESKADCLDGFSITCSGGTGCSSTDESSTSEGSCSCTDGQGNTVISKKCGTG